MTADQKPDANALLRAIVTGDPLPDADPDPARDPDGKFASRTTPDAGAGTGVRPSNDRPAPGANELLHILTFG